MLLSQLSSVERANFVHRKNESGAKCNNLSYSEMGLYVYVRAQKEMRVSQQQPATALWSHLR